MAWVILFAMAAALWVVLVRIARPGRVGIELVAAALLLGIAGYAWQGSAGIPGSLPTPKAERRPPESLFAAERGAWMNSVGPEADLLTSADSFIRNGDADYAVGILNGALRRAPDSMMLWLGLANALVAHADGVVTPPARYAYSRAAGLAPANPAAAYFMGLALAQSGDLDGAEQAWRRILAVSPADAPWRPLIASRLSVLAQIRDRPDRGS